MLLTGIMTKIRGQKREDAELAEKILSWICFARKPLSIPQLQHALAVEPNDVAMRFVPR
jgi:hypothetical protein